MSATTDQDELAPSQTPGYKVGEKKTLDEYATMDSTDESLNRWKASLGLAGKAAGSQVDGPKVIILHLALEVPGREDVILDLSSREALENVKNTPFVIKEGVEYQMKVKFRIQHEVVCGLKYIQVVKRKGIKVDKTEEMIGSYGPNDEPYEKKFMVEEAPSGMFARGHYEAKSKFIDDDGFTHCEWNWSFDIKKDWD
ncbi:13794_t:CDS:2 [Dentiscutata erythropus]|uniref:Rho GDP-dissociation inhibitor n=1 Tax=Dentiscutata erythropus TaxID=1348616 RepID=A0A9N9E4N6_9GLOM|nr:13794_t:CDS:2 [Dentiscutata erythropus]